MAWGCDRLCLQGLGFMGWGCGSLPRQRPEIARSPSSAPSRERKQQGHVLGVSATFRTCFLVGDDAYTEGVVLRVWGPDQQHPERSNSQAHPRSIQTLSWLITDSSLPSLGLRVPTLATRTYRALQRWKTGVRQICVDWRGKALLQEAG